MQGLNRLQNGWFAEINDHWAGFALSLQVKDIILDRKSEFQHVQVFRSATFGNVLVLDGAIQLTERDEMAYQEMIVHLPMFSHPNPETVLVVGGGDGGVLREVLRHPTVKKAVICEIDKMVIDISKEAFKTMAWVWDDPRVEVVIGDAAEYVARPENKDRFDVVICDTTDPEGPARVLFEPPFYRNIHAALKSGGRACCQAESVWFDLDLIKRLVTQGREIFANAEYATTQIPTYPGGQIGLLLLSKEGEVATQKRGRGRKRKALSGRPSCVEPLRRVDEVVKEEGGEEGKNVAEKNTLAGLNYYTSALHTASFSLPKFARDVVDSCPYPAKEEAAAEEDTPAKRTRASTKGTAKAKAKKESAEEEPEPEGAASAEPNAI